MIKTKDLLIVSQLRKNSRETLTSMGKKIKVPISTIYDKIKSHENGFIQKHTTLIDFNRIGFSTRVNVMFKVKKEDRAAIKEWLMKSFNVNSLFKINNGYDYMAECVFRNIKDLEDFIELTESKFEILEKHSYYVIEDIVREAFLSDPALVNVVMSNSNI